MFRINGQWLTVNQVSRLAVILITSTAVLYIPSLVMQQAGNGGWVSPALSMLFGLLVIFMVYGLAKAYPGKALSEYIPLIAGNTLGKVFAVLYALFFWHVGLLVVREVIWLIHVVLLPDTPLMALYLLIFSTMAYMLSGGLAAIARVLDFSYVLLSIPLLLLVTGTLGSFHSNAFLPLLDEGWSGVLRGAFVPSFWYGEIIVAAMWLPNIQTSKGVLLHLCKGLLITTVILIVTIVVVTGTFGAPEAARMVFPTFLLIQYIQSGEMFQHLDAVFLFPWLFVMFLKAMLFYHSSASALSLTFGIKQQTQLVIPLLVLSIGVGTWIFPRDILLMEYLENTYAHVSLVFDLVFPLLFVGLHRMRRFKKQKAVS